MARGVCFDSIPGCTRFWLQTERVYPLLAIALGHGESYSPLMPGFPGESNIYQVHIFYRNIKFQSYFDTLRLHLRLVRALQMACATQECCIHRACGSQSL